ncbi:MAG: hypothetical protein ACYDAK_12820 [Candidatus Limnocylindrales bacterium]
MNREQTLADIGQLLHEAAQALNEIKEDSDALRTAKRLNLSALTRIMELRTYEAAPCATL